MIDQSVLKIFSEKTYIFWDFDGVIKDSVRVKSDAFGKLFESLGDDVIERIKIHHETNAGISRFEKIPVYLGWAGRTPSTESIAEYADRFSKLVKQKVIESDWVPGVHDFIRCRSSKMTFFLVTATPQPEIEEILDVSELRQYFRRVVGSPTAKQDAIQMLINEFTISRDKALMVGDTMADYKAAMANRISFVLRRNDSNQVLQGKLTCPMIDDFNDG